MNRRFYIVISLIIVLVGASSRTAMIGPPGGLLFAHVKGPVAMTSDINDSGYNAYGEARAWSIFYVFTFGDASIEQAKQNGSDFPAQVRVTHADYEWIQVLGVGRYTLRVYFFDPGRSE